MSQGEIPLSYRYQPCYTCLVPGYRTDWESGSELRPIPGIYIYTNNALSFQKQTNGAVPTKIESTELALDLQAPPSLPAGSTGYIQIRSLTSASLEWRANSTSSTSTTPPSSEEPNCTVLH